MHNTSKSSYLHNVLEVLVALLVDSRLLKVPPDARVFPDEHFAVIGQPIQHLILSETNAIENKVSYSIGLMSKYA